MLPTLYRNALWIAPLALAVSATLLAAAVFSLLRLSQSARLFDVAVASPQPLEFNSPGPVVLSIEGPRATQAFSKLTFRIRETLSGGELENRNILFRLRTSGTTTTALEVRRFEVAKPGPHELLIEGLTGPLSPDHRIVFTREHTLETIVRVLAIIASAFVLIASVVAFILRLSQPPGA